jgi:hypothetical protein
MYMLLIKTYFTRIDQELREICQVYKGVILYKGAIHYCRFRIQKFSIYMELVIN